MARFNLTDAYVSINGVDLSSYVRDVTWNEGSETTDATAMGDDTRAASNSLKSASIAVSFHEDLAASAGPYQTCADLVGGAAVTVIYGPGGSTASATNPHRSCSMAVTEYNVASGAVGDRGISTFAATAAGSVTEVTS